MRLRTLLVLGITGAAVPPLLLLGFAATRETIRSMSRQASEIQPLKASNLATFADTWMTGQLKGIRLMRSTFDLDLLDDAERVGFERLVYNQFDHVNIVSLLTPEGTDLAHSQMASLEAGDDPTGSHESVSRARYEAFRERLPVWSAVRSGATAMGVPYQPPDGDFPVVPIVLADPVPQRPLVAVELSLAPVVQHLHGLVDEGVAVGLLDAGGSLFAHGGPELIRPDRFTFFLGSPLINNVSYELEDGERIQGASATVPCTGWLAVVVEPSRHAIRALRTLRNQAAYIALLALCLSAIVGHYAARRIHQPVRDLAQAARDVGEGRLDRRVVTGPIRELAELGSVFNTMSSHLEANRDEILRQRQEIEAFNVELQERVEDRTRELREAQARLVESGKLAAVAEIGAGVAHELNNPLAGILGSAQILRQRTRGGPDDALLAAMESEAARCADIVRTLLSFTKDATEIDERAPVDLRVLVSEVESLVAPSFRQRGVGLRLGHVPRALRVHADRVRLGQALAGLLTSLRALVPSGGTIVVQGESVEGRARLAFELDAPEAPAGASRDDWLASGMSLWLSRRVLAEQGAALTEPVPGGPARYLVDLPGA
ncbi:MAG: HAMP domain-containing protein [Deltaproteobacteria bacterium]|nr:HAMP domain-containing protein [Deltaproteobacteria bacterium]